MDDLFYISVLVAAVAVFIRLVYLSLLPRPIPGIPCHEDSTRRIPGDFVNFIEMLVAGGFWSDFMTDLLSEHQTPIAQCFLGPFKRPHVVIGDYREASNLMTKRSKVLGRGYANNTAWRGVIPEHFIAMDSFHPSFKDAALWKTMAAMADGLSFDTAGDLEGFTYDIMMTAAFGMTEQDSQTMPMLRTIKEPEKDAVQGNGSFHLAMLPRIGRPELGHVVPKGSPIIFLLTGPTINMPGAEVEEARRCEPKTSAEGGRGGFRFNNRAGPFLSFSAGPRGCWGKRLAYLELKLIVALLVWDLEFMELYPQLEDHGLVEGLFTKPKPCNVKLWGIASRA
ncbi:hypothetical protein LX36DRAFT_721612 [Colletotrichum falcatum]|nr:hypothetical protein LX36DRAFT_721612 [Colletotrichum falcatum]